ncbi:hypothetical protein [Streptomyces sp. NPDC102360]|uniref:hypothetical protein n=1 Tax=Streptomyces sp. NPDC102360 TaxID=3366160 RepID=UPI003829D8A0
MTLSFTELKHIDDYEERYGRTWPRDDNEWSKMTAAYLTVEVDGWAPEGWVHFLPGGLDGAPEEVGHVVLVRGNSGARLPARVCREDITRAELRSMNPDTELFLDFDQFMTWLNKG